MQLHSINTFFRYLGVSFLFQSLKSWLQIKITDDLSRAKQCFVSQLSQTIMRQTLDFGIFQILSQTTLIKLYLTVK